MLRLNINSQKHGNMWLDFNSQAEIDAYIAQNEISGHWGKLAYIETIPATEQLLDENGEEISPATSEQIINHPATVSFEVISSPAVQENINKQALAYLASTDWMITRELETGILCPAEIKQLRQTARESIVR